MACSLYYEAKRGTQITGQEQAVCQEIVERYCSQYSLKKKVEDFGVYDVDRETDIIFSGATKLPDADPQTLFDAANYWLECLTEITNTLAGCQWTVTFDDVDLILDSDAGWRFPTDEEYNQ